MERELLSKLAEKDKLRWLLKPEAMTDMFKCRKCGSRHVVIMNFRHVLLLMNL